MKRQNYQASHRATVGIVLLKATVQNYDLSWRHRYAEIRMPTNVGPEANERFAVPFAIRLDYDGLHPSAWIIATRACPTAGLVNRQLFTFDFYANGAINGDAKLPITIPMRSFRSTDNYWCSIITVFHLLAF